MLIDAYNIDLRMARAKLWAKRDYIKEALIHMSDISPAMSKEADFYGLKAMLLLKDNQASKAEGLYEQLVEVEPEYTPWRLGWAMSLEQLDEYEKAQSLYNDLLAIENDPTRYYFVQNRLAVVEKKIR
jgi:tetratricopeptide (TPR) repeat protein